MGWKLVCVSRFGVAGTGAGRSSWGGASCGDGCAGTSSNLGDSVVADGVGVAELADVSGFS